MTEDKEVTEAQRNALMEISSKIVEAQRLLRECEKIAEEHKVVVEVYRLMNMNNTYVPEGGGVNEEGWEMDGEYGAGWQQSSC